MFKSLALLQEGFVSSQQFKDQEISRRLLNLRLSKHQDVEHTFTSNINSLDVERDENRYLLSAGSDGSLAVHDLNNLTGNFHFTSKCIHRVPPKSIYAHKKSIECITWFPSDNGLFVTSGGDMKLKLWDTNLMKPIDTLTSKHRINHHECSVGNQALIAGNHSNSVEIVDLRTGHNSHELSGHQGSVMAVKWSPRETCLLLSAGMDGRVKMWDVRSSAGCLMSLDWDGSGAAHMGFVNGLTFTPDGLHVLTFGSDHHLRLWDSIHGQLLHVNYGRIKNHSFRNVQMAVDSFVFVPSKGMIHVLDLWTGCTSTHLCGHFNRVLCCTYRDVYQELYSGGSDRNVLVWAPYGSDELAGNVHNVSDGWSSDGDSGQDD